MSVLLGILIAGLALALALAVSWVRWRVRDRRLRRERLAARRRLDELERPWRVYVCASPEADWIDLVRGRAVTKLERRG